MRSYYHPLIMFYEHISRLHITVSHFCVVTETMLFLEHVVNVTDVFMERL